MALPDFLIIGAMKCGTSTLAAQLGAQPGIFMTTPKEPEFFSEDANFARGRGWYEALFANAAPGALLGEASTGYTKLPTHPQAVARIAALLPAPRLIYLIRDPLHRLVSHYIHEWTMGMMEGSLGDALAAHPELVDYGRYGMQIAPYVETFGADRILLLSLEEMQADPQAVLERVVGFLGAPGRPAWVEEHARANASAERIRRLPLQELLIDNPLATALRRTLVPQALRDRVKRARQMQDRPRLSPEDTARLTAVYAADRTLLARHYPGHAALTRSYPFLAD
jgi:hypothetical protein